MPIVDPFNAGTGLSLGGGGGGRACVSVVTHASHISDDDMAKFGAINPSLHKSSKVEP